MLKYVLLKSKKKPFLRLQHIILEHFEVLRGSVSFTKMVQFFRKKRQIRFGPKYKLYHVCDDDVKWYRSFSIYCILLLITLLTTLGNNQQYVKMIKYFSIITVVNAFTRKNIYGHFYRNDT